MIFINRLSSLSLSLLSMLLLSGCSYKIPSSPYVTYEHKNIDINSTKQKLLIKRFIEYWDARARGNYKISWKYELPYQKYLVSFQKYKKNTSGYRGVRILLDKILLYNDDEAILQRKVIGKKEVINKKDKWYFIENNWYHKFYQTILPPKDEEEAEFQ